jgi:hypothetical protein
MTLGNMRELGVRGPYTERYIYKLRSNRSTMTQYGGPNHANEMDCSVPRLGQETSRDESTIA